MERNQSGLRKVPVCAILAAGVGLAACDAQASAHYHGEPLLSLRGQVTVNALTGGLPIIPALCFHESTNEIKFISPDELPAEVASDFADRPLVWPLTRMRIVDVDSVGEFPANFDVAVYLPPAEEALKSPFTGEPHQGTGSVCAVRADHADVVSAIYFQDASHCDSEQDGPCRVRYLWATPGFERYYTEAYACPKPDSPLENCLLSASGDAALKREGFEDIVGFDKMQILYLAESAAPSSFTAWRYGASEGLSEGYHLFAFGENNDEDDACVQRAADAAALESDTSEQFQSRYAQYLMEMCEPPPYTPVSAEQPLSIEINKDWRDLEKLKHAQVLSGPNTQE